MHWMFNCGRDERDTLDKGYTNLFLQDVTDKKGVAELGGYLSMPICLLSCLKVCMNTQILDIIIPRDNKFGMSVAIYNTQIQMF